MNPSESDTTTRRQWAGFWSMIVLQTFNAFNDKMAQFILVALAGAVAATFAMENYATVILSLPLVLFAPLAGWLSDRFSKRSVMLWATLVQVATLAWICWAVWVHHLLWALAAFFVMATQAAFFSPAKFGITKELIGGKHIGFGSSIQQMAAMIAFLAGQILSGWWFDVRYHAAGGVPGHGWWAALVPLLWLTAITLPTLLLVWIIPKVSAQGSVPLTPGLCVRHITCLGDLWRRTGLRRASFGAAFFWGFAAFVNIWSVKVAKHLTGGGEGFGTLQAKYMAAASLGMVAGFGTASMLQRKRIELGWVPLAGICMAAMAVITALADPTGHAFLWMLAVLSFCSAIFLAPINAWLQDNYPADKRGELQASVNLQDCFASILGICLLALFPTILLPMGVSESAVYRIELIFMGVLSALMAWFSLRLLPGDFVRVLGLALARMVYKIRPLHRSRLPEQGGVLLLPNHVTWIDSLLIAAAVDRPVRFVMDELFLERPAIRWFVRLFDTVTIRRNQPREAIRMVIDGLHAGDVMCFFPEGQLTRTGALSRLQGGCELIARKAGCPVVPLWCDGSWGSVFSFERNRFFWKWPYRPLRYSIRSAFGEPLPEGTTLAEIRNALCAAAADAHDSRFLADGWSHRVPRDDRDRWNALKPADRRRFWINGHQIGQINGLQRGQTFFALAAEAGTDGLPRGLFAFVELFKARPGMRPEPQGNGGNWVGGNGLRAMLENAPPSGEMAFYDFSARALEPLAIPGLRHFPCLAVGGLVIAMTVPNPPMPARSPDIQRGGRPGTYGKLLPGWSLSRDTGGRLRAHGPAAPAEGILLPANVALDDQGNLGAPSVAATA